MTIYFVITLAILAWLLAAFFAFDWYRMRRQRDEWQTLAERARDVASNAVEVQVRWRKIAMENIQARAAQTVRWGDFDFEPIEPPQPRGPNGRFIKRGK